MHVPYPLQNAFCFAWYFPCFWVLSALCLEYAWITYHRLYLFVYNTDWATVKAAEQRKYGIQFRIQVSDFLMDAWDVSDFIVRQILSFIVINDTLVVDDNGHSLLYQRSHSYSSPNTNKNKNTLMDDNRHRRQHSKISNYFVENGAHMDAINIAKKKPKRSINIMRRHQKKSSSGGEFLGSHSSNESLLASPPYSLETSISWKKSRMSTVVLDDCNDELNYNMYGNAVPVTPNHNANANAGHTSNAGVAFPYHAGSTSVVVANDSGYDEYDTYDSMEVTHKRKHRDSIFSFPDFIVEQFYGYGQDNGGNGNDNGYAHAHAYQYQNQNQNTNTNVADTQNYNEKESESGSGSERESESICPAWIYVYIAKQNALKSKLNLYQWSFTVYFLTRLLIICMVYLVFIIDFVAFHNSDKSHHHSDDNKSDWDYYSSFYLQLLFHPSLKASVISPFLWKYEQFCKYRLFEMNAIASVFLCVLFVPFVVTHVLPALILFIPIAILFVCIAYALLKFAMGVIHTCCQRRNNKKSDNNNKNNKKQEKEENNSSAFWILVIYFYHWIVYSLVCNLSFAMSCLYTGQLWTTCAKYGLAANYCRVFVDWQNPKAVLIFVAWVII